MFAPPSTETLNRFFLLSWLVVLWQVLRQIGRAHV